MSVASSSSKEEGPPAAVLALAAAAPAASVTAAAVCIFVSSAHAKMNNEYLLSVFRDEVLQCMVRRYLFETVGSFFLSGQRRGGNG